MHMTMHLSIFTTLDDVLQHMKSKYVRKWSSIIFTMCESLSLQGTSICFSHTSGCIHV